jgi:hypothetical protein
VAVPAVASTLPSSYAANMLDMTGFVRPLAGPAPMAMGSFTIGFTQVLPGRVPLDTMAGIHAPGYLASRFTWAMIAIALAALAGLLYRPHLAAQKVGKPGRLARWSAPRPPGPANPAAPAAGFASSAFFNLVRAEFHLIGEGRVFISLAGLATAIGARLPITASSAARPPCSCWRSLCRPTPGTARPCGAHPYRRSTPGGAQDGLSCRGNRVGAADGAARRSPTSGPASAAGARHRRRRRGDRDRPAALSRSAYAPRLVLLVLWYGFLDRRPAAGRGRLLSQERPISIAALGMEKDRIRLNRA